MRIIQTIQEMQDTSLRLRGEGRRLGLVPTMGYLHEGHLSLFQLARERVDDVIASIFVNPTQFGPGEDLSAYPRDLERDRLLCEREDVDIIFAPDVAEMYTENASTVVEETRLTCGLCGTRRPGHFRGVTTVVAKLFNIVLPHVAVFGQKDAQQAAVIRKMVQDLNFPVDIVVGPIVRELDGLAMSSRNVYLSVDERRQATCLFRALSAACKSIRNGRTDAVQLKALMESIIAAEPAAAVDYVAVVDNDTLEPLAQTGPRTLIALAVRIGKTRLIDNAVLLA